MRILATVALSFGAGCLAASLIGAHGWLLWVALAAFCAALAILLWKRSFSGGEKLRLRALLILFSLAASLCYCVGYERVFIAPLTGQCGEVLPFEGTVTEYPVATDSGAKVTVSLGFGQKAVYYGGEELLILEPGQTLRGSAY